MSVDFVACVDCDGSGSGSLRWPRCTACGGTGVVLEAVHRARVWADGYHPQSARALRIGSPASLPLAPIRESVSPLSAPAFEDGGDPRTEQLVDGDTKEVRDALEVIQRDAALALQDLARPGALVPAEEGHVRRGDASGSE